MPNPKFYPNSLPAAATTTTAESAVGVLEGNVRSMALAQQANRRKAALFSCREQNKSILGFANRPIPFDAVGVNPAPEVVLGTIAYSVGGQDGYNGWSGGLPYRPWNARRMERLVFAGEVSQVCGTMLSQPREGPACVSHRRGFFSAGGLSEYKRATWRSIDRTDFTDEATKRIGAELQLEVSFSAGCGSKVKGWFFGGLAQGSWTRPGSNRIQSLDFSSETTEIAGTFPSARWYESVAGDRTTIVLMGSLTGSGMWSNSGIQDITLFTIATETYAPSASSLSGIGDSAGGVSVSNYQHVYRMGGIYAGSFYSADNDQVIRYSFGTDSVVDVGIDLVKDVALTGGWQSSRHGFVFGGYHSDLSQYAAHWPFGTDFIQKLKDMSGTESTLLLGEDLKIPRQEIHGSGDFAPGFVH